MGEGESSLESRQELRRERTVPFVGSNLSKQSYIPPDRPIQILVWSKIILSILPIASVRMKPRNFILLRAQYRSTLRLDRFSLSLSLFPLHHDARASRNEETVQERRCGTKIVRDLNEKRHHRLWTSIAASTRSNVVDVCGCRWKKEVTAFSTYPGKKAAPTTITEGEGGDGEPGFERLSLLRSRWRCSLQLTLSASNQKRPTVRWKVD